MDRLLASPHYGERWGRHWLDIWRYSDWYGYRVKTRCGTRSGTFGAGATGRSNRLNKTSRTTQMIEEMLAGDELAPDDPDVVRATGYPGAQLVHVQPQRVAAGHGRVYVCGAFLGLTMKCARCHTHKYDPIPHADYYRFRAFFEPHDVRTDRVPGEADISEGRTSARL